MFSTYDGAKRLAKKLRNAASANGANLSLGACQTATAVAGGYRDWQHLRDTLGTGGNRVTDPRTFGNRLRQALPTIPASCAESVIAALHRGRGESAQEDAVADWAFDIWLMRTAHPLCRQGSGPGLLIRQQLVNGIIQQFDNATFDETDNTITFEACELRELFGDIVDDHRFPGELDKLIKGGIYALHEEPKRLLLTLLPPPPEALEARRRMHEKWDRKEQALLAKPEPPPRPTKLSRAQRAMLQEARDRPIGPDDRHWAYHDLSILWPLLESGSLKLVPIIDGRWAAAITADGNNALRTGSKPARDKVEAAFVGCAQGDLIFVGSGAWNADLCGVPVDGKSVFAFARRHGLALFGAVRVRQEDGRAASAVDN